MPESVFKKETLAQDPGNKILMVMNCSAGWLTYERAFIFTTSHNHSQRSSSSQASDTARSGFEPMLYIVANSNVIVLLYKAFKFT